MSVRSSELVAGTGDSPVPAVTLHGITKRFGAITACEGVDLEVRRGRIHGLLGENGAGKSTLMKILIGLVLPDAGHIEIDGNRTQINDPLIAAELGIGMVHQHFSLVDRLTVWENVGLGETGRLDPAQVRQRVGEISEHYGLDIDPDARVEQLTAGLRQRVEIIKCLRRDPGIVIFDEPTSVLTPDESQQLFGSLRDVVAAEGRAVILVSHKLDEVLSATDEITIMRQGAVVDRSATDDTTAVELARAMVGRDVKLRSVGAGIDVEEDADGGSVGQTSVDSPPPSVAAGRAEATDAPALQITDATARIGRGIPVLDELSLEVRGGEILGIAGVEGNGQRALGDLLSSLVPLEKGVVRVGGVEVSTHRPGAMARSGLGVIPEDRHDSGVVLDMTVAENLVIVNPGLVASRAVLDQDRMRRHATRLIDEFEIQCAGPDAPMWSLSGGNQQRVVLARELDQNPTVLVAAQPTRGLDVGAIEYMGQRLRAAADAGVAVLLISGELDEILDLSDRIAVMYRGRIVGEMRRQDADLERLGLLMGGATV